MILARAVAPSHVSPTRYAPEGVLDVAHHFAAFTRVRGGAAPSRRANVIRREHAGARLHVHRRRRIPVSFQALLYFAWAITRIDSSRTAAGAPGRTTCLRKYPY